MDAPLTPAIPRVTVRGAETRARIVTTATALIRARGVGGTTLDDIVAAAKVSKSQLYSHFSDKPALVRAVIENVGERVVARERMSLGSVTSIHGLQRWRDGIVADNAIESGRYGCALGSLANEVAGQDEIAQIQLDRLFSTWRELFEDLVRRFQSSGTLPDDVDAEALAIGFLAAVQGGYLLAQTSRDVTPMTTAIDLVIAHLELLSRSD